MRELNLLYTGCSLAGCKTSIEVIAQHARPPFQLDDKLRQHIGWRFGWLTEGENYAVRLSYSRQRSYRAYASIEEASQDGWMRPEIDFLRNVDGIVFVVDSAIFRIQDNLDFLETTREDLLALGRDLEKISMVFQFNKRDLPDVMGVPNLRKLFHWPHCDYSESIATQGFGVLDALTRLIYLVVEVRKDLNYTRYSWDSWDAW